MIVTIDNNTRPVELYHLSILFQSLAKAHGFVAPVASNKVSEMTVELNIDTSAATAAIDELAAHAASKGVDVVEVPPATVTVREPGVVHNVEVVGTIEPPITATGEFLDPIASLPERNTDTNLDSSGLPWDARIHAGSRERNTDGSWRVRRRPKDTDQDAWDATIARVTAELTDLMSIPVSPGAVADAAAETAEAMADCFGGEPSDYSTEPLSSDEVDAFVDIMDGITAEPVIVAPPVTIAPPVVVPPVTAVAPPITVTIETFPQVMVWLTAHTPKDEAAKPGMVAKVNQILTDNGLTVLQQLNQRPDLIPQIMSQFIDAFGE